MLSKIKALAKQPLFWVLAVVIVILAYAFSRFVPSFVKKAANALPGSDAKVAATA